MSEGNEIDTRRRAPGTIILRIVAIRIGETELPEEVVANIDFEPDPVKNLLPTAEGQKAWIGFAINGARQVYTRLVEKGWI